MYLAMIERAASRAAGKFMSGGWLRSSVTWIVLLVLGLVGAGVVIHERGRGHLHELKTELGAAPAVSSEPTPQPGGKDPLILSRAQQAGAIDPEFLSATLLPGRGMNVLQITAYLPGKGEVSLLEAPSLAEAAKAMAGIEADVNGEQSLAMGGAIEIPWAGQVAGASLPGGTSVMANWRGRGITLPVNSSASGVVASPRSSVGGLLLRRAADSSSTPGDGAAQATFAVGDFEGDWPSKTEVKTNVLLNARSLEVTVTARNVGTEPEPMGIGWQPRFAIPTGQRAQTLLRLPSNMRAEVLDGLPTGRLLPVEQTAYDFAGSGGTPLNSIGLNDTFVHLKGGTMSTGPEVELRNPAAGYGIRLTLLSPTIKAIHVYAPADKPFIAIDPQSNYDDPFGREWGKDEDTGLVILQPGESMQWKIRLELFQLASQKQ